MVFIVILTGISLNNFDSMELNDAQLIERFIQSRDEAAFEALLKQHGPMVYRVCGQVLSDPHDVQDAFQATFLVFSQKASSIHKRHALGSWLYGVAYRTASHLRAGILRRRENEEQITKMSVPDSDPELDHVNYAVLHKELNALPQHYREPLVLCYLQELSYEQIARELGWTIDRVTSTLKRAKERLRERMKRKGAVVSAAALGGILSRDVAAAETLDSLITSTLKGIVASSFGKVVKGGVVPVGAVALARSVLWRMTISPFLKVVPPLLLLLVLGGIGTMNYVKSKNLNSDTVKKSLPHVRMQSIPPVQEILARDALDIRIRLINISLDAVRLWLNSDPESGMWLDDSVLEELEQRIARGEALSLCDLKGRFKDESVIELSDKIKTVPHAFPEWVIDGNESKEPGAFFSSEVQRRDRGVMLKGVNFRYNLPVKPRTSLELVSPTGEIRWVDMPEAIVRAFKVEGMFIATPGSRILLVCDGIKPDKASAQDPDYVILGIMTMEWKTSSD
jgi:RNA polymerase sigma factor (sigma-70 family)